VAAGFHKKRTTKGRGNRKPTKTIAWREVKTEWPAFQKKGEMNKADIPNEKGGNSNPASHRLLGYRRSQHEGRRSERGKNPDAELDAGGGEVGQGEGEEERRNSLA